MVPALVLDTVNLVIKGSFNPALFSPAWLRANGIIGDAEHENAEVEVITQDVAQFKCVWLSVTVTREALQFGTDRVEEFERVRDATVATLELLPHVPLAVMGINRSAHFEVGGVEAWHRLGDTLAPKEMWEGALQLAGMKSVTLWGVRPDQHSGRVQVTVEPSSVVKFGIFVSQNDHFDLVDVEKQPETRDEFFEVQSAPLDATLEKRVPALSILRHELSESLKRASAVMMRVQSQAAMEGFASDR